ncbi:hypothetical protein C1H76_1475 [Elsinoe australis]|uniref:Uncharacterized protein n=1 Tax=Elsinoe australis TaxID=40998 RepID=A0A4U7B462_9PEZI|nr:hypothetical protein C1H76_1475 [Elsinoe australis]
MAAGEEGRFEGANEEADMAKAFQALAQGEHTATTLENHLTKLESRIDELLKQANENQELAQSAATEPSSASSADASKPSEFTSDKKDS